MLEYLFWGDNKKRKRKGECHLTWTLSVWTLPFLQDSPAQWGHCLFGHGFPHFWTVVCFMLNKRLSKTCRHTHRVSHAPPATAVTQKSDRSLLSIVGSARGPGFKSWISPCLSGSLSVAAPPQLPEGLGVEPLLLRVERSQLRSAQVATWWRCSRHVNLWADPEHTGGIISLSWTGNALWSPRMSWMCEKRMYGHPYLACCHREPSWKISG